MTFNGKPTSANQLILWDGTKFVSGFISDANISPSATIDGYKILPNFGTQNIATTGTILGSELTIGTGSVIGKILSGNGVPTSSAPDGSLYLRIDGSSSTGLYTHQSGIWSVIAGDGSPTGLAGGDLSGTYPNPEVVKLNGNPVILQSLSNAEDGYVLTWVDADGYWEAKKLNTGAGGGGSGGNSAFAKITSDVSTTSNTFADLLTQSITIAGSELDIHFSANGIIDPSSPTVTAYFQILIDGVLVPNAGAWKTNLPTYAFSCSSVYRATGLTPGAHTVKVQWKTDPSGNVGISAVGFPFTNGANLLLIEPGSGASAVGGWISPLDLDLTAQTPQTLSTDGTYSIGGLNWTKFNTAGEAAAMTIDTTGLTIQPASATDYNGVNRTFPGLMLDLAAIIPNYDPSMAVKITLYNSALNNTSIYDNAILALDTGNTNFGYVLKRGNGTTGLGGQSFLNVAGNNVSGFVSDSYTPDGTNQVMVLEIPGINQGQYTTYRGNYSGGFPAPGALTVQKSYAASGSIDTSQLTTSMKVVIGAQRAGSGTSLVAKFSRIKVEYKASSGGASSGGGASATTIQTSASGAPVTFNYPVADNNEAAYSVNIIGKRTSPSTLKGFQSYEVSLHTASGSLVIDNSTNISDQPLGFNSWVVLFAGSGLNFQVTIAGGGSETVDFYVQVRRVA